MYVKSFQIMRFNQQYCRS